MSPRRTLLVASAVAITGLIFFGGALRLRQLARERQQNAARLQGEALAAHAKTAEIREQVTSKRRERPPAAHSANESAPQPRPAPPPPKQLDLVDIAKEKPEILDYYLESKKAETRRQYQPLFRRLALDKAVWDEFEKITVEKFARRADLATAAKMEGRQITDPTVSELREKATETAEQRIRALLGEAGYREYQDHNRFAPMRGYLDSLAVQLTAVDPLRWEQTEQLTRALTAANTAYQAGKMGMPEAIDWVLVDASAAQILSPAQLAVWNKRSAHNPSGGSRLDQELKRMYDRIVATRGGKS